MKLLVDIGNTRLKWCIDHDGCMTKASAVDYRKGSFIKDLQYLWARLEAPDTLAIASVGSEDIVLQLSLLAEEMWSDIHIIMAQSSSSLLSVTNAYTQPEKLGIDRWLGLMALRHYYAGQSCIIDCGTAITIDYLDQKGLHVGGLICPGLQLMKQSLSKGTEDLPLVDNVHLTHLAKSTESAIALGTLYAAAGLIEKTLDYFGHCNHIVITGGDAELLAEHIVLNLMIEPDFILKGLSLYCE